MRATSDGHGGYEDAGDVHDLDYYSEGINVTDDEVWVTDESGADKYDGDEGRNVIETIPLDDLDDD